MNIFKAGDFDKLLMVFLESLSVIDAVVLAVLIFLPIIFMVFIMGNTSQMLKVLREIKENTRKN